MPHLSLVRRSCALLLVVAPLVARAQGIPEKELPQPSATLKDGLKSVSGLRELSDGRVLIVDAEGERLVVADLASGKVETRMKAGTGDDEFRVLGPLWPWPGDSLAAADIGTGRLTVFSPDGTPVRDAHGGRGVRRRTVWRRAAGGRTAGGRTAGGRNPHLALPRASIPDRDRSRDRCWSVRATGVGAQSGLGASAHTIPDSADLPPFDAHRHGRPVDGPAVTARAANQQSGRHVTVFVATTPLQALDTWAAMSDGTVAVVRAASYRIEWYAPNGERTVTDSVPYTPLPVTGNDKKRVLDDYKRVGQALLAASPARTSILAVTYSEPQSWPATHPPFRGDIVPLVDADDRIWLATRCAADDGSLCYDVIDRTGERVERYRVPPKTRVAGFGKNAVYTAHEQKSDKELLQRHPLH